jgi:glycine/D-amino acid oxidase-like deaminating enzyme
MSLAPVLQQSDFVADAIVIGGGFYGCETALELKRLGFERIILVEREAGLLRRASFVNQARVHNGYHYPRAYVTAFKSRKNFEAFVDEYAEAVMHNMEMYYAIARGSRVSADQFEAFCQTIGAYCKPAHRDIEHLFEPGAVERVFSVRELAFDTVKLASRLRAKLQSFGINLNFNSEARVASLDDTGVDVEISGRRTRAKYVFNCTYAGLERVGIGLKTRIKKELTEMVLISPPPQIRGRGFTVMDGPFFSTMPFPASGLHTLSHVRYTPHESTFEAEGPRPVRSNGLAMLRDAARYMPCLLNARIEETLFELKAILITNEHDDARPILVERTEDNDRVFSILGGKIDNVYELRDFLRSQVWR